MESKLEVGKRYLFKADKYSWRHEYYEATVVELSPSGKTVKLRYVTGNTSWTNVEDLEMVEVL